MPAPKCPETGKISFEGRNGARAWVRDHRYRHAGRQGAFRAYLCPFCHYWHLTRQRPRWGALENTGRFHRRADDRRHYHGDHADD